MAATIMFDVVAIASNNSKYNTVTTIFHNQTFNSNLAKKFTYF